MKKKYVKPVLEIEEFSSNEYVAACTVGKENATLYAECVNHKISKFFGGDGDWGGVITNLSGTGFFTSGDVNYTKKGRTITVRENITGWNDLDGSGTVSEGDAIEWRADCYGTVKSTQNHS